MIECDCWRKQNTRPRGESAPNTIETLQAAWDRDQEFMTDQKDEISRLKQTVNNLRLKLGNN